MRRRSGRTRGAAKSHSAGSTRGNLHVPPTVLRRLGGFQSPEPLVQRDGPIILGGELLVGRPLGWVNLTLGSEALFSRAGPETLQVFLQHGCALQLSTSVARLLS